MFKKLTYRLLLVSSLFLFFTGQQILAADKTVELITPSSTVLEKVKINSASVEQLSAINGLGNKKAQAIIDYRQANGDFLNIDELIKVKGIGQSTLKKITPFVTL